MTTKAMDVGYKSENKYDTMGTTYCYKNYCPPKSLLKGNYYSGHENRVAGYGRYVSVLFLLSDANTN